MRLSTSIRKLALLGFALVVLPLAIGLAGTVLQVDRLARTLQETMVDSTRAVETGRLIASQALSMERAARQYLLLGDVALLLRYERLRTQLAEAADKLRALHPGKKVREQIDQLMEKEEALYRKLLDTPDEALGKTGLAPEEQLLPAVRPIPLAVTRRVTRDSERMRRKVAELQRQLLWQAAALIPLALVMAGLFGTLIARPLRRLGGAIRQLGEGDFSTPVRIRGPRDIRELGEELERMRCQLAALEEQKLQFLRHVSHELKTPLTTIREGAGLLNEQVAGSLTPEQQEVTRILEESSHQLQGQVESLLNFNLALAQPHKGGGTPLDLAPLVEEVVEKHALPARARGIRVILELHPAWIQAVEGQLRLVIDNLISNAVKYTPDGGRVTLATGIEQGEALLVVCNTGPGIAAEDRSRIFEPFYQGRGQVHGPVRGTGLGLSIARHYARLNDGEVVLVEHQKATCFKASFPAIEERDSCIVHQSC